MESENSVLGYVIATRPRAAPKRSRHHHCTQRETLLEAARQCGVYVPTACQQGICGTCRIAKLSGEVVMDDLGGLTLDDKSAGYVLACCSRPQGDVLLDL
ncbi:2Fe-2S iron-sulfur cluster binding domain-containing protein [Mesorhizobium sp. M0119]|uniref:2Fe-2S iron-sulfur cluster-binding protein n=1 Tax=unclassified Mesorhizobium TaxID=325217 RepID=UPI00333B9451